MNERKVDARRRLSLARIRRAILALCRSTKEWHELNQITVARLSGLNRSSVNKLWSDVRRQLENEGWIMRRGYLASRCADGRKVSPRRKLIWLAARAVQSSHPAESGAASEL